MPKVSQPTETVIHQATKIEVCYDSLNNTIKTIKTESPHKTTTKTGAKRTPIYLGTDPKGVEIWVDSLQPNLCKESMEFYKQAWMKRLTLHNTQKRLLAKLQAKKEQTK